MMTSLATRLIEARTNKGWTKADLKRAAKFFYLDYARDLNEYEIRIAACASINGAPVQQVESSRQAKAFCGMEYASRPTTSHTMNQWSAWAGGFIFLAFLPAVSGFVWRFILARLREVSRALRGID